jgi:hypothetical protein
MQRQSAGFQPSPLVERRHPFPPQPRAAQAPMVYVYERQQWEYKVVVKNIKEPMLSEDDLNALGLAGWELAGTATLAEQVQFFFKRVRK